jgi:uncharacterized protein (DUF736 family)
MAEYDDTNTWVLFVNDNKKTDKHPDYTGYGNRNGKKVNLAAWKRTTKDGKTFLSGKFNDPIEKSEKKPAEKKTEDEFDFS